MRRDELTRETISHLNWGDKAVSHSSDSDTHIYHAARQLDGALRKNFRNTLSDAIMYSMACMFMFMSTFSRFRAHTHTHTLCCEGITMSKIEGEATAERQMRKCECIKYTV